MMAKMIKQLSVVLFALSLIMCLFSGCKQIKSEYEVPMSFEDGFVGKIKVPENTTYEGEHGATIMDFKTTLSEDEVQDFYDDYFSTLQKVYSKGSSPDDIDYYYDKDQRMIFYDLNIIDNGEDRLYFFISCDTCEDINNNELWTAEEP